MLYYTIFALKKSQIDRKIDKNIARKLQEVIWKLTSDHKRPQCLLR